MHPTIWTHARGPTRTLTPALQMTAQDEAASHGPDYPAASVQNAEQTFAEGTNGRQGLTVHQQTDQEILK